MYLGKRNIYNPELHEQHRSEVIKEKCGAVWNAFVELEGLINKTQIAEQYFGKTHGWFSQKLHGCSVFNKQKKFTEAEYHQLAEAFRDIARRLEAHADEIDSAELEETE